MAPPRQQAGTPFDQWVLDSFPREGGITSKTQQHDDTIYLDLTSRPWLVPVVNLNPKARKRDEELFSFTMDASNLMPGRPQQTRHEACTAQTFTERRRGSPHIKALKGRTAVVLMDAGAPFAKALRCFGLVVHSCPMETLSMPQARDRISRLCRESSFVVFATLPSTYIDGVLAVRDSHGKPWPDTSSRTKGRCRTEDRFKFLWPVPRKVFGPSTEFSAPLKTQRQVSHGMNSCQPGTRFKSAFIVASANLLNVPDNSLCIAPHRPKTDKRERLFISTCLER